MGWGDQAIEKWFGEGDKSPERSKPARKKAPRPKARGSSAKYDAAQTTEENRNLWRDADGLSANVANSVDVRQRLRNRSRYEDQNNGYYGGLILGRANDTVGTGPRLQLSFTATDDSEEAEDLASLLARQTELLFQEWDEATGFGEKVHLLDTTWTKDGESFALFVTNRQLPENMPRVDLLIIEAEQISTPGFDWNTPGAVDGIRFDENGIPIEYDILKHHPGDSTGWAVDSGDYNTYRASSVIHLFDRRRPSQARGIPAMTAGLPLFGQLRRYGGAVLTAAEVQAMFAAYITQRAESVDRGEDEANAPTDDSDFETIPVTRGLITTLPRDVESITAFQPTQPIPSFREYESQVLTQAGRGINASRNQSTGSSAEYNYSSGRMDRLPSIQDAKIRRNRLRIRLLNRVLREWYAEARIIPGYLPEGVPVISEWRVRWQWDAFPSIDPVKDATANEILLQSGQTTLEEVCAERGMDWEEVQDQQLREERRRLRKRRLFGLPDATQDKPTRTTPSIPPDQPPSEGI
jgi:lambda family phage portal protein